MIYNNAGVIPNYRIKNSDEISSYVGDLAIKLKKVSINEKSLIQVIKYGRLIGFNSVFNEIEFINPYSDILNGTKSIKFKKFNLNVDYWADLFINYYKDYFKRNLKKKKDYWVMHSSGGDSRILSAIIANLRDSENFPTNNIKFITWYPEAEQSEKILLFLGFNKQQIWKVGYENIQKIRPEEYWNETNFYDFKNAGFFTNGEIQPFGMMQSNFWKPYYKSVKNISVVMAMIGDMIMGGRWWSMWARKFFKGGIIPPYSKNQKWNIIISASTRYNGLGLLGFKKDFDELLAPTMDFFPAKVGVSIPFLCRYNDNIRIKIQEKLFPGLSNISNEHGSWYRISFSAKKNVIEDYYKTLFYKKLTIKKTSSVSPAIYSMASLYDYLIQQGVMIKK